ncbi:amino acid permease, partial [Escherichia coli]|nr:amino acid permease [Escherichia coli]
YAVLGEMLAWVVGWSLMLEYTVVCSAVAVGWAGHVVPFIQAAGIPEFLLKGPEQGGLINLPAVIICFVVAGLLLVGTRESANVNLVLVVI